MIVKHTHLSRPGVFVLFKWAGDADTYEVVVAGIEDDREIDELIEAMIQVGAHEGNDFDGWSTII